MEVPAVLPAARAVADSCDPLAAVAGDTPCALLEEEVERALRPGTASARRATARQRSALEAETGVDVVQFRMAHFASGGSQQVTAYGNPPEEGGEREEEQRAFVETLSTQLFGAEAPMTRATRWERWAPKRMPA